MADEKDVKLLLQKRELLMRRIATMREFVRGSVVLMKRRCTYKRCRKCASGERHPTWVMTVSHKGKTRTVYLGKDRMEAAQRLSDNYHHLLEWVEQAAQANLSLLLHHPEALKGEARDGPEEDASGVHGPGGRGIRPAGGSGGAEDLHGRDRGESPRRGAPARRETGRGPGP